MKPRCPARIQTTEYPIWFFHLALKYCSYYLIHSGSPRLRSASGLRVAELAKSRWSRGARKLLPYSIHWNNPLKPFCIYVTPKELPSSNLRTHTDTHSLKKADFWKQSSPLCTHTDVLLIWEYRRQKTEGAFRGAIIFCLSENDHKLQPENNTLKLPVAPSEFCILPSVFWYQTSRHHPSSG